MRACKLHPKEPLVGDIGMVHRIWMQQTPKITNRPPLFGKLVEHNRGAQ